MCVLHLIRIPWAALFDGLLACWLLSGALFWFASRGGVADESGVMGRSLLSVAAYAAAFAIWLGLGDRTVGYPWLVAVAVFVQLAAIETVMRRWGPKSRLYPGLYGGGAILGAGLVILWHPAGPVAQSATAAASLPGQILLGVNLAGAAAVIGLSLAYGRGRGWFGGALGLLAAGLSVHDLALGGLARMILPWSGVAGALLLPASWWAGRSLRPTAEASLAAALIGREEGLRHGQAVLDREAAGVLYCYLDGHRPLVDSWGVEVGDRVLERAALEVGRVCRQGDVLMRWEGGAFLVVYPGILFGDERTLQDRVLSVLSEMRVSLDGRPVSVDVEARVGWGWGDRGASFMDVVSEAGRAMVEGARSGGRGSVS